jgi:peroxiredoxin
MKSKKWVRNVRFGFALILFPLLCSAAFALRPTPATDEQKKLFEGTAELSGRLTWCDGSPAANERFDLLGYDAQHEHLKIAEVVTDGEGRYRATGLRGKVRYRLWQTSDSNQRSYYIPVGEGKKVEYNYQFQPRLGDTAPEHVMPDLSGKPVDLADYRGKIVVMKFWAVWCGPCHAEMEKMGELIRTKTEWKDRVAVMAVNADPERRKVEQFIKAKKLEGMVHLFEEGKKWESVRDRAFRVNSIPFTFVIDVKGIVRFRGDDSSDVEKLVDELLKESE